MKKRIIILLALIVMLPVLFSCMRAKAAEVTEETPTFTEYDEFRINCKGQVYFQFVKTKTPASLKATAWIPAVYADGRSYIDFSDVKKTSYVAITTDPTATKVEEKDVIELLFPVKTIKTAVNYLTGKPANVFEALSKIEVTDMARTTISYDGTETKKAVFDANYVLEWKRGMNGTWREAKDSDPDFALEFAMLRATDAALYLRVSKAKTGESIEKIIPSKEVKVKIGKTAAAPSVKQDYKKGTIAIKNGMEFDYSDKTYYIPAFKSSSAIKGHLKTTTDEISSKVSAISIEELETALKEDGAEFEEGGSFTLKVRMSATAKKYASWPAFVEIALPEAAPGEELTARFEYCSKDTSLRIAFAGEPVDDRTVQYALGGADADVAQLKFTDVKKKNGEFVAVKLDSKIGVAAEYFNLNGDKIKTLKTEEAYLYVRYAGISVKNKEKHPGLCVKMQAAAVEETTIVTLDEEAANVVSFIATAVGNVAGGGATVTVDGKEVRSVQLKGEPIKFKVIPNVVKDKDGKERSTELLVKLSGKPLTADKDGFYSTGTLTKGAVVLIDVTYGDAKPEETSPTPTP